MRNTLYDGYLGVRLPMEVQKKRVKKVIEEELTEVQREILMAYYFGELSQSQIAAQRGINKSTVCRTLHRAENRLRMFLKY